MQDELLAARSCRNHVFLSRACVAGRRAGSARRGVDRDDVPLADVVAVVALGGVTGGGTEVLVVAGARRRRTVGAAGRRVVRVARHRVRDRLQLPPRRVVRLRLRSGSATAVLVVAERQDRVDALQQLGGVHGPAVGGGALRVEERLGWSGSQAMSPAAPTIGSVRVRPAPSTSGPPRCCRCCPPRRR